MTTRFWLTLLAGLVGCVTTARDPFVSAKMALQRDDLVAALMAYDAVPVTHARYPEARAAAMGVEQRMRRGQELVLEALMLRGEWRDDEAVAALQRARSYWPGLPGVEQLITATELRLTLLDRERRQPAVAAAPPAVPMIEVAPRVERATAEMPVPEPSVLRPEQSSGRAIDVPVAAFEERAEPAPAGVVLPETPVEAPRASVDAQTPGAGDPVALALVVAEGRLARGDLDRAISDLIELARRHPDELRVRLRLSRILHQRALRHYGEGALAAAISDWERVVELDPNNEGARSSLSSVRAEHRRRGQ